jgi:hypothetical protein
MRLVFARTPNGPWCVTATYHGRTATYVCLSRRDAVQRAVTTVGVM